MPAITLPAVSVPTHSTFQTDMDGVTYGLETRWNERAQGWFLRIFDAEGNELLSAVRIVVGFFLAKRSSDPRMPPGVIVAMDTSGQDLDPGLTDLGARVQLLYFPATG